MGSWFEMLKAAMEQDGEDFEARVCTMDEAGLKREFDDGFGLVHGERFTCWGKDWVYFPIAYDGAETVGHAPRNPCDIAMEHQGGW